MKLKEFFDKDFKAFSIYDAYRSIPNIVDGFKPSQRKSIYGILKKGGDEIKVARAAAAISELTDYHHGEVSLEGAIIKLAQDYPGTNNINLLVPEGQFGSRLTPEASASRYIFTAISENFRKLFKKEDDLILKYLDSDGEQIEPEYYYPILPIVLINGSEGIGTGFASTIFNYNPKELKIWILCYLKHNRTSNNLIPWYKGFNGKIYRNDIGQVIIEGKYEIVNTTTIRVTELPLGIHQDKYKDILIKLQDKGVIKDFDDNSNESKWDFIITVPRTTTNFDHDKIMSTFKLISRDTENYTLWTENNKIRNYGSVNNILIAFTDFRLKKYEERRLKLIELLKADLIWLEEKRRFVRYYLENHLNFAKKNKKQLFKMLEENKFYNIDKLLKLPIYSLTKDEIEKLKNKINEIKANIKEYKNTNSKEMYIKELEELKL